MESLNERLKKKRKEIGLSQTVVAELAGITQSAYAQIENGNTKSITIEAGKGIAKALGVSFTELFEIEISGTGANESAAELEKLRDLVKEQGKRIEEKDLVIEHLQRDNKWLKYENALYRILNNFIEIIQDELFILGVKEPEREPHTDIRIEGLKEIIDSYIKAGYPDKKSILHILFNNIDFIEFIELKTSSKEDFIKECTLYLNKFFSVSETDVEKFIKYNVKTKWDSRVDKITKQMKDDFFQYWKDSE
jgi:transcriptional regulator with XRE-family HTH domain